jgi:pimeloyl-ACP methyl ester carboxylesterase
MIAAYLKRPDPAVIDAILISLTHFGPRQAVFRQQALEGRERAQRLLSANKAELQSFPIAYCRKYTATAPDILSYYRWDSDRVLQALGRSPVPVTVVVGSEDKRMTPQWLASLKQAPMVDLRIIQGASHFFDAEYEFSLLDTIDEILQHLTDRQ